MSFVVPVERKSITETLAGDVRPRSNFSHEAWLLTRLAVPTVIIQTGVVLPPFFAASYVGRHFGSVCLDAFTLASLTVNLSTLSLLAGLYSASDTLSPQAFGVGNYSEVGLIAIRGFVCSLAVLTPVSVVLLVWMEPILLALGQDEQVAMLAHRWYQVYVAALPFYALYNVTWKFLSAQNCMMPLVGAVLISAGVILPLALEVGTRTLGFLGSSVALVVYQAVQALSLIAYLGWKRPHHSDTWSGLLWRQALSYEPLVTYVALGMGGMLASSEWFYWECVSLIVGTLGVVPLSVHTVPTQVLTMAFMVPLGVGVALAIRLGATLPRNVLRAKELAAACLALATIVAGIVSVFMYTEREAIFRLFITEPDVLKGCHEIWWKVCVYFFNLAVFGINMGIATGLGMQWLLGLVTIAVLWLVGLPAVYYFAIVRDGGLSAVWSCIFPPYVFINAILLVLFVVQDWDETAKRIRLREGVDWKEIESLVLVTEEQHPDHGYQYYGTTNKALEDDTSLK